MLEPASGRDQRLSVLADGPYTLQRTVEAAIRAPRRNPNSVEPGERLRGSARQRVCGYPFVFDRNAEPLCREIQRVVGRGVVDIVGPEVAENCYAGSAIYCHRSIVLGR